MFGQINMANFGIFQGHVNPKIRKDIDKIIDSTIDEYYLLEKPINQFFSAFIAEESPKECDNTIVELEMYFHKMFIPRYIEWVKQPDKLENKTEINEFKKRCVDYGIEFDIVDEDIWDSWLEYLLETTPYTREHPSYETESACPEEIITIYDNLRLDIVDKLCVPKKWNKLENLLYYFIEPDMPCLINDSEMEEELQKVKPIEQIQNLNNEVTVSHYVDDMIFLKLNPISDSIFIVDEDDFIVVQKD